MRTFLIRHAAIAASDRLGQREAERLTAEGREQASKLAGRLAGMEIAAVFSSPLTRAMETAQLIAERAGVAVIVESALREVDAGEWENRTFEELAKAERWKRYNSFRAGTRPPGGEMMLEVQARTAAFLERASREYPNATVCAVSHADVIRAAVCHYIGVPLDLALRLRIDTASVTILRIEDWGAELQRLNDAG
jgi:broad specificity phosphatase PhoE